jgi:hypothetical protein
MGKPLTFDHLDSTPIPDPDNLTPEQEEKLSSQPWFRQMVELHEAGVPITTDLMTKLATKPGSHGYKYEDFEPEPGKKQRALVDIATGEIVPQDKLKMIEPDFTPKLIPLLDPKTGKESGTAMTTSKSSAVPFQKPGSAKDALAMDYYQAAPIYDEKFNVLGHTFKGPDGQVHVMNKGMDPMALMAAMNGTPAAGAGAGTGDAAAGAAPTMKPAYRVQTPEDYEKVPAGADFLDPTGVRRTKKAAAPAAK